MWKRLLHLRCIIKVQTGVLRRPVGVCLFLSVREMELRKVHFDASYQPGEIEFVDVRQNGPLVVKGTAELVGTTQEIWVRGSLQVVIESDCDRCLEIARFPIDTVFDLFYRPEDDEREETAIDTGESEIAFYEGGGLDLKDIIREQVLLALPMQRVCAEACKGICSICGQNRNVKDCGCEVRLADDRWAALKNLKQ